MYKSINVNEKYINILKHIVTIFLSILFEGLIVVLLHINCLIVMSNGNWKSFFYLIEHIISKNE